MKISDIKLEMELYGVDLEDITEILEICKAQGYDIQALDEELEKKGVMKKTRGWIIVFYYIDPKIHLSVLPSFF